jgi:predicted DNA-binding protein with PD1-like motif
MNSSVSMARDFKPEGCHIGRIEKSSDIIHAIEAFCEAKNIRAGWVNVIGAVDKAVISYYDQRKHQYFHKTLEGEYEIVSCSGNISIKDGKPFAHLHIILSDTEFNTLGGHLWPGGSSVFAAEFVIFKMQQPPGTPDLTRCPDAETGLTLW